MTHYSHLFGLESKIEKSTKYINFFLRDDPIQHEKLRALSLYPSFLFYGIPGTGKTSVAQFIYTELKKQHNIDKYYLNFHEFSSSNFGESSKNLNTFFTNIKEDIDKNNSYAFIIADEVDSFTINRTRNHDATSRVLLTLNQCIDDIINSKHIFRIIIIAISNYHSLIDPAVLRRFCFHENFDLTLDKSKFHQFIENLVGESINIELSDQIYQIYKKRNLTLGEVKRIYALQYLEAASNNKELNITSELFNNHFSVNEIRFFGNSRGEPQHIVLTSCKGLSSRKA